jgi:hypothetical protein
MRVIEKKISTGNRDFFRLGSPADYGSVWDVIDEWRASVCHDSPCRRIQR